MAYKVPVIAGDGIGPEVIAEGKKVIRAAEEASVSKQAKTAAKKADPSA